LLLSISNTIAATNSLHWGFAMPVWTVMVLAAWSLAATSACCFGQEAEGTADTTLTREQWQQRVEEARRRSEEFVANARTQNLIPPPPDQEEKEAADRAMNDPSLQQGDIVATGKGFVVFVGRDEQHKPSDFISTPDQRHPR
jgi:hypothetical protein